MENRRDMLTKPRFLMFENETNICWLDASIVLVAHNETFKKIVKNCPESHINKIISSYNEAVTTLNNSNFKIDQRISKTKEMLLGIQNSTLEHLKQFLKFKPGEPDSAFCALLSLIYQDKSNIKDCLNISWVWRKQCSNCTVNSKYVTCLKPIITLCKVNNFHPEHPSSIYTCSCKLEQEMKLIYKELPPCLIFHFEKGAGTGANFPLTFSLKGREYQLTSIVILERDNDPNLNHFVTWIRNPSLNMWLECNDLNAGITSFSPVKPKFDFKDIYMCVFESQDNVDKITNNEASSDQEQNVEKTNVEVIDLSGEADDIKNTNSGCKTTFSAVSVSKAIKNNKTSNLSQNSNYSEVNASEKEPLVSNRKDKTLIQSMKMCSNEKCNEYKKHCNIITQNVCDNRYEFPNNIFPNKCEIEAKCKNFHCPDKAVNEFVETDKFIAGLTDYQGLKFTGDSFRTENEISSSLSVDNETSIITQKLEMCTNEKSKESEKSNVSNQNISVSNLRFPPNYYLDKNEIEAKYKNFDCKHKAFNESVETKELKTEATDYRCPKVIDASVKNKKESFPSLMRSDNVTKSMPSNGSVHEKFSEKKPTHNSPISSPIFKITSDVKENEENKYEENKLQIKMKQISLKRNVDIMYEKLSSKKKCTHTSPILSPIFKKTLNENEENDYDEDKLQIKMKQMSLKRKDKYVSSSKEKRKTEDGHVYSNKGSTNDTIISLNKAKRTENGNNQTVSTSVANDEITKTTLQQSKRPSISKHLDYYGKKARTIDLKTGKTLKKTNHKIIQQSHNTDETGNNQNVFYKISDEKLMDIVDSVVKGAVAAFFKRIFQVPEEKPIL